jgi:hypothetical protein
MHIDVVLRADMYESQLLPNCPALLLSIQVEDEYDDNEFDEEEDEDEEGAHLPMTNAEVQKLTLEVGKQGSYAGHQGLLPAAYILSHPFLPCLEVSFWLQHEELKLQCLECQHQAFYVCPQLLPADGPPTCRLANSRRRWASKQPSMQGYVVSCASSLTW